MAHSSSPSLNTDHRIALAEDTELDRIHDTPFQTTVNVLLPWLRIEVWLLFWEVEWINTTVEMRVLHLLAKEIY